MANIINVIEVLQKLTGTKITQSDIARVLNITRATVSKRIKMGSNFNFEEIKQIGDYYGINLGLAIAKLPSNAEKLLPNSNEMVYSCISSNLKKIRREFKYTVSKMAEILGVQESTYESWEKEAAVPSMELGILLYKKFNINLNWFCTGLGEMFDNTMFSIGARISYIKNKNNLSNSDFAELLNISVNELINIMNDKTPPDLRVLKILKQKFNISLDWLII